MKKKHSFKVMDMVWSICPPDDCEDKSSIKITIPSTDNTEYELNRTEAIELYKNLGEFIGILEEEV